MERPLTDPLNSDGELDASRQTLNPSFQLESRLSLSESDCGNLGLLGKLGVPQIENTSDEYFLWASEKGTKDDAFADCGGFMALRKGRNAEQISNREARKLKLGSQNKSGKGVCKKGSGRFARTRRLDWKRKTDRAAVSGNKNSNSSRDTVSLETKKSPSFEYDRNSNDNFVGSGGEHNRFHRWDVESIMANGTGDQLNFPQLKPAYENIIVEAREISRREGAELHLILTDDFIANRLYSQPPKDLCFSVGDSNLSTFAESLENPAGYCMSMFGNGSQHSVPSKWSTCSQLTDKDDYDDPRPTFKFDKQRDLDHYISLVALEDQAMARCNQKIAQADHLINFGKELQSECRLRMDWCRKKLETLRELANHFMSADGFDGGVSCSHF